MRVHVAFTPREAANAQLGIVVDVLRATSTIAQALAVGYERVYCCREVGEARALRDELGEGLLGGERNAVRIEGFDVGASPREFAEGAKAPTLILSTTNGTSAILAAAARCETVLVGSLLNLTALVAAAGPDGDVAVYCAGFKGGFALDDAYCAGRIVARLPGERTDAARAAELLAASFPTAQQAFDARTYGPPGLEADIAWCAQEDLLETVPRFVRMEGPAAELLA
jgi:2-phosphosulfolactate phosphatase